ncbi:DUF7518 family protein [Halobellus ordinarius]|uniref:DUF7518 family protein n=1 Tax=Halobellus ordinarius TaxID=3075120 RepID=UPI002880205B|nr:hypothetical protein [Halobellus sp. ZY16]
MSNRVEELESKVAELQAAVNGLTEELVETKERVRLLEEEVEVDLTAGSRPVGYGTDRSEDATADDATADEAATDADPEAETVVDDPHRESAAQAESRREASAQHADDADFIDADAEDHVPSEASDADGDKGDEADGDDEAATEDDDIIVA